MMKKLALVLSFALAATALFAASGFAATTIKIGHVLNTDHSWHKNLAGFANDVKKETEGRVTIQLYPSGQLGNEKDMVEGLTFGTVDGGLIGGGSFQSIDPKFGIEALPYAWPTHEAAYKAFDGKLGKYLFDLLGKKGIVGLAWWENGFRHITNNKKPVVKPEDLKGKKVAVVGGGNVAMDAARCSKRLGAEVYVVYRRGMEELPARHEEVEHAIEEGVIFKTLNNPVQINGDEQDCVRSMTCIEMELGEPDASGRRRPVEKKGSEFDLPVDAVIMSLGTTPNPLIKATTKGLEVNKKGCIIVNEDGLTSREGVYAGGDAVTGAATVILAMGAGKLGAKSIDEFLNK